nr:integrase, catalytic region, zinc finger, CCHC-type, peptidase aspartic, catalytic [Tanacetum cinerariifolium]
MLDRTDFASWQQRIRLYCQGKENEVNILKSIDEGPYQIGIVRETFAESTEEAPQFGPKRSRVYYDLTSEEKDRYNADIHATNILLQGLPKDIYTFINHYTDAKDIWDNVKMLLEGFELTKEDQENQATVQDDRVVVQNVQGRPNRGQGMNPQGGSAAGYGGAHNRVGNVNQGQARTTQENRVALDAEQLLFLTGGQDNVFDDDVDEQPVQDLALNVNNVFQADDYDAFNSDVDEAPTYAACAHHEGHVTYDSVQLDHVVDSHADYMIDSNMIPYDQYVKDNEVPVVHSDASSNTVVKNSLTAELATYKEHVELYEQRAKFELTEREQKINEQLRLVISDRNFKEETLKRELHSIKLQLASTINHNKSMVEEVSFLKKDFKQTENKYLEDFLDMKSLKEKPGLYNGHEIIKDNHTPAIVHNAKDTLEIAEITGKKMNAKMNEPECVTRKYPDVNPPSPEISNEESFQAKVDLMNTDRPIFLNNEDHPVQNRESPENSSEENVVSKTNQEPPQDSNMHQLIDECCEEVHEEQKQKMEDTMFDLVEICHHKQFLCIHDDDVDDLIESALDSTLLSINSINFQRLDKKEQEVKIVKEQPAERRNRAEKSLQNFRVIHKSFISLNTSQISLIHAVAPSLSTKKPENSLSMGYEHLSITPETESDEVTKSNAKNLLPIPSECEVTLEDKRECDELICENSSTIDVCDNHFEILFVSNNDDLSSDDESFEDIEYIDALVPNPVIVSIDEENVVQREEE